MVVAFSELISTSITYGVFQREWFIDSILNLNNFNKNTEK